MNKNGSVAKHMIENAKKIALFGHMSPDGDCIGAMLGLGKLLEKQKKKISYFVPNKPSKVFDFIKGIKKIKSNFDYKKYDLLIFVDFTWIDRIGIIGNANPWYFDTTPLLVFDHHIANGKEKGLIIKDVKSISTCEILFEHTYTWWPKNYDKEIATYFYLGITSDSGNFLFGENHVRIFTNALKLLKLWADKDFVVNNLIRKKSFNSVKFLQLLLNRIQQKDGVVYTYYDELELKKYDVDQAEAAYALHIIQNIDGPDIVLLIRKNWDMIKWSLRAKNSDEKKPNKIKIDCNKIAQQLWGGGHKLAAWFNLPAKGKFEKQIQEVVRFINKIVKTEK